VALDGPKVAAVAQRVQRGEAVGVPRLAQLLREQFEGGPVHLGDGHLQCQNRASSLSASTHGDCG